MARKKLLIHIVLLMFLIFMMDKGAHKFYWYNSIWYFDMIMHFLGGLWVGLFFIYIFSSTEPFLKLFFKVILLVVLIGLSWEVFEYIVFNIIGKTSFDIIDTSSDIFWDLMGGFMSLFYFLKKIMSIKENTV